MSGCKKQSSIDSTWSAFLPWQNKKWDFLNLILLKGHFYVHLEDF
jgi:hypothetical protein